MGKKGFVFGALAGATLGMLFAPKTGKQLRQDLSNRFDELMETMKDIDVDDVREQIETKVADLQMMIQDLDREKVMAIAQKQANAIKKQADEIVDMATKAAKPALEQIANETRKTAIKATKEVLKKLEAK